MTCTFDPMLPGAKDRVRLILGDIPPNPPPQPWETCLRPDETINALITAKGEIGATAELAAGLAAQYAQQPDTMTADGATISYRQRVETWAALAKSTQAQADAASGTGGNATVTRTATRGDCALPEYYRQPWEVGFPRFEPDLHQGGTR